jgi:GxxExxY protein
LLDADLTEQVIGVFYDVYNELGTGFLESVYENALALALRDVGLEVTQQSPLNVEFRGHLVGEFRADLLIERRLIVELKAVSQIAAAHEVQLVNYLRASGLPVGLLLNFGNRPQFKRRIYGQLMHNPRLSASIRVRK